MKAKVLALLALLPLLFSCGGTGASSEPSSASESSSATSSMPSSSDGKKLFNEKRAASRMAYGEANAISIDDFLFSFHGNFSIEEGDKATSLDISSLSLSLTGGFNDIHGDSYSSFEGAVSASGSIKASFADGNTSGSVDSSFDPAFYLKEGTAYYDGTSFASLAEYLPYEVLGEKFSSKVIQEDDWAIFKTMFLGGYIPSILFGDASLYGESTYADDGSSLTVKVTNEALILILSGFIGASDPNLASDIGSAIEKNLVNKEATLVLSYDEEGIECSLLFSFDLKSVPSYLNSERLLSFENAQLMLRASLGYADALSFDFPTDLDEYPLLESEVTENE